MKFQPWGRRILVKRVEVKERTASGLYIPEQAKEKPMEGHIVALGLAISADEKAGHIRVGDKVIFGKYAGVEIKVEGAEHMLLQEDEIMGTVAE